MFQFTNYKENKNEKDEGVENNEAEDYVHLEPLMHYLTQDFEILITRRANACKNECQ